MMKMRNLSLITIIVAVGWLFTVVVAVDLLWRGLHRFPASPEWTITGADIERGRTAIELYGCGACHVVPGVRGAQGRVGPQLNDFSNQIYIAGHAANVPDNLIVWLQNPEEISPGTAMPNLGVSEQDARDMAAFLYTLR